MPPGGHGMGFGPGSRNFMSEEEKKNLPQVTPELLKRVLEAARADTFMYCLLLDHVADALGPHR